MIKLYALKCRDGYIKETSGGLQRVELKKASVYDKDNLNKAKGILEKAEEAGFVGIHLVELTITEKRYI